MNDAAVTSGRIGQHEPVGSRWQDSSRNLDGLAEGELRRLRTLLFRLLAAVLAGTVAIAANMALLSFANNAGITTGNGGLLRLFAMMIQRLAWCLHLIDGRSNLPLPSLAVFHIVTGLAWAIAYVLIIEPKLPGRPFSKGLVYGTVISKQEPIRLLSQTGKWNFGQGPELFVNQQGWQELQTRIGR